MSINLLQFISSLKNMSANLFLNLAASACTYVVFLYYPRCSKTFYAVRVVIRLFADLHNSIAVYFLFSLEM